MTAKELNEFAKLREQNKQQESLIEALHKWIKSLERTNKLQDEHIKTLERFCEIKDEQNKQQEESLIETKAYLLLFFKSLVEYSIRTRSLSPNAFELFHNLENLIGVRIAEDKWEQLKAINEAPKVGR